jgi:hypothetical protein
MGDDEDEDDARCSPAGFSRHAVKGSSQPGTNRQARPGDSTEEKQCQGKEWTKVRVRLVSSRNR